MPRRSLPILDTERTLGYFHLLLGVPLALTLIFALLQEPRPRDRTGWVFGLSMFAIALGLNGAGTCLLLGRRELARRFHWLPAIGIVGYMSFVAIAVLAHRVGSLRPVLLAALVLVALIALMLHFLTKERGND